MLVVLLIGDVKTDSLFENAVERFLLRFNRTVPSDLASVLHLWSHDLGHPSQRRPGRI